MKKLKAIVITGFARSGKDTMSNILCKEFGFRKIVFSDFIGKELRKNRLKVSKSNLSMYGDVLRKKHGMEIVAKLAWNYATKKKWKKIVFAGARSLEEIKYLKKKIKRIKIIAIKADFKTRFKRRTNKKINKKDFKKRDKIDSKNKGLSKVISKANYSIQNNGRKSELKEKTKKLMYNLYK